MKTVHAGQNIQCNICDSLKGSLEAPLRSKHEELELKCQLCELKSVHGSSMMSHTKIALMGINSLLQSMQIHKCLQLAIKATCLKKAQLRRGLFQM